MGRSKEPNQIKLKNCESRPPLNLITTTDVHSFARTEDWPSHHTRKAVKRHTEQFSKAPPDPPANQIFELEKWTDLLAKYPKDITKRRFSLDLARECEPQITLVGRGLRSEIKSNAWGGMFFRVLADEEEDNIVIQYIYTWVQQKLPYTFWNWLLPLTVIIIFGIILRSTVEIGIFDTNARDLIQGPRSINYVDEPPPEWSLIVDLFWITFWAFIFVWQGLWPILVFVRGWIQGTNPPLDQRGLIILSLGGVIGFCIFLHFLCPLPMLTIPVRLETQYKVLRYEFVILDIIYYLIAILVLSAVIITKFQESLLRSKNRVVCGLNSLVGLHPMDYAPIFVYLKKTTLPYYEIVDCQWDHVHYKSKYLSEDSESEKRYYKELQKKGGDCHIQFVMKDAWHSFDIVSKGKFSRFWTRKVCWRLSLVILAVTGLLTFLHYFSLYFLDQDLWTFGKNLAQVLLPDQVSELDTAQLASSSFLAFFITSMLIGVLLFSLPIALTLTIWLWPTTLETDEDFEEEDIRYSHLTCKKLQVLWNLPVEARFQIQQMLQDPTPGAGTFRNKE